MKYDEACKDQELIHSKVYVWKTDIIMGSKYNTFSGLFVLDESHVDKGKTHSQTIPGGQQPTFYAE